MFEPTFTITHKILELLSQIAEIKGIIQKSSLLPTREAFLRVSATIKMAHTSTSIEGNTLTEYQVKDVASGKPVLAENRQVVEVENYLQALKLVDHISQNKSEFSPRDILLLHKTVISRLVDKSKTGAFRTGQVYVVNVLPNKTEKIVYTPPASSQIPILIENLIKWLKDSDSLHPVVRAGLLHYQFETIHPFTDGNGRVGRLLTLLHLYQSGWDFRKLIVPDDYYNRNRKNYYQALQTGSNYSKREDADLTKWLEYYIEGFLEETKKVRDQITILNTVGEKGFTQNTLNTDELKIVDFVLSLGKITSSDVVDILKVPKRTAQSKLKRLEGMKVLKKESAGPSTFYTILYVLHKLTYHRT